MNLSLVEQHASVAAFLWTRREGAVRAPHYTLATLCDLDERLEAHLDGLRVAGDTGWEVAREAASDEDEAGAVFVAAALALGRRDVRGLAGLLDLVAEAPERQRELIAAMGWAPWGEVGPLLPGFFDGRCPPLLWRLGLAACGAHRRDPGGPLGQALYAEDAGVRARALRLCGELGRGDVGRELGAALGDADEGCRFWATWTAALLGDARMAEALWPFASGGGAQAERAIGVALRVLPPAAGLGWIEPLSARPGGVRMACVGAAAIGDATMVPWLLEVAKQPEYARIAGWAIRGITGIVIAGALAGKEPEGFSAGPSEDPKDERVELDPDEHLPWPALERLGRRCQEVVAGMARGTRYLEGKAITPEWAAAVLREGAQPARAGAAVEAALRGRRFPLFEVRAPGARQRGLLG